MSEPRVTTADVDWTGHPHRVGMYRWIPGDRWLSMGPGARRFAQAALWVELVEKMLLPNRLVAVGEPMESIEYDEERRGVRLCAETRAIPRTS